MHQEIDEIHEPDICTRDRKLSAGIQYLKDLNVVIKHSDKNLGIVAMRGDIYRTGLEKALKHSFRPVPAMPHADIVRRLANIIKLAPKSLYGKATTWLRSAEQHMQPSAFYVIPKIHKKQLGFRPIAAAHSYTLASLSIGLSHLLNAMVNDIGGIAKSTHDVIMDMEENMLPAHGVFLCFDVVSMYPSMDINDTLQTLAQHVPALNQNKAFLYKALQLLLRNSYVTANNMVFQQMRGLATGTQAAPAIANLYFHYKVREILDNPEIFWSKRYIDDGIIYCSAHVIDRLKDALLKASPLELTFEQKNSEAVFLDVHIYKGQRFAKERKMDMKPFFKPTNKLLMLPFMSAHPMHQKLAIVRGEAIRTLRASTDKTHWLQAMNFIFHGLIQRG
jgi:hypothetical protein